MLYSIVKAFNFIDQSMENLDCSMCEGLKNVQCILTNSQTKSAVQYYCNFCLPSVDNKKLGKSKSLTQLMTGYTKWLQ